MFSGGEGNAINDEIDKRARRKVWLGWTTSECFNNQRSVIYDRLERHV